MNRKGNGILIAVIVIAVLGVIGFFGSQLLKETPKQEQVVPTKAANPGDIDRSGVADESDRMLIRGQMGCVKADPCWNKTVGKTKDGDNPLYTYDLDLDKDGAITQKDIDLVK